MSYSSLIENGPVPGEYDRLEWLINSTKKILILFTCFKYQKKV